MNPETSRLDKLFSEFIRRRAISEVGGCQRCLTPKLDSVKEDGSIYPAWMRLQCAHMFTRKYYSVRWDEDNAAGICAGCHFYLDSHPQEKIDFFKQRLGGEKYDLLTARANTPQKIDKKIIELYLKSKIEELE